MFTSTDCWTVDNEWGTIFWKFFRKSYFRSDQEKTRCTLTSKDIVKCRAWSLLFAVSFRLSGEKPSAWEIAPWVEGSLYSIWNPAVGFCLNPGVPLEGCMLKQACNPVRKGLSIAWTDSSLSDLVVCFPRIPRHKHGSCIQTYRQKGSYPLWCLSLASGSLVNSGQM